MREQARSGDSFKKLTNEWTLEIEKRMKLEQRLLFLEFQKRGQKPTEDIFIVPSSVHKNSDNSMGEVRSRSGFGEIVPNPSLPTESMELLPEQEETLAQEQQFQQHSLETFNSAPLPPASLLKSITVHVDGWIIGLEMTYSYKTIDRAPRKGSPKSKQKKGMTTANNQVTLNYFTEERTVLHGKKSDSGSKNVTTFVLENTEAKDDSKREKIVAMEGFMGDVVGRLRFITSTGRRSAWYGQVAIGEHFMMMGDRRRTPDESEIVGFHGVCDHDGMRKIGCIVRYTLEAPLFSHVWCEYAQRKRLEEEEQKHPDNTVLAHGSGNSTSQDYQKNYNGNKNDDDNDSVSNDESQFASVIRMRNCDILQALEKAQLLVRRLRRHPSIPSGLQPLKIALALGAWYFESLTYGLVQLRGADVDRGERLIEKGEALIRKGERIMEGGKRELSLITEYRKDGKHALRPAVTGRQYVNEVKTRITQGETIVDNGRAIQQEGVQTLRKGFELMPQIPKRRSLKRYFEKKVTLAIFESSVPPEMFEVDRHSVTQQHDIGGADCIATEQDNIELMLTAEQHKTKSTTESTEAFLRVL